MPAYFLLPQVYVCRSGEHVVWLDVRANAYFSCRAQDCETWCALIEGWPCGHGSEAHRALQAVQSEADLLRELATIVTPDRHAGKSAAPLIAKHATHAFVPPSLDAAVHVPRGFLWQLTLAWMKSWWKVRIGSFESALAGTRPAESALQHSAPLEARLIEAARCLVAAFCHLKPIFFRGHEHCLLESLTLLELLRQEGIGAQLVIGVDTEPFAAHAWAQWGDQVLNDAPERIQRFVPTHLVERLPNTS